VIGFPVLGAPASGATRVRHYHNSQGREATLRTYSLLEHPQSSKCISRLALSTTLFDNTPEGASPVRPVRVQVVTTKLY
jgi:hypothetical protein